LEACIGASRRIGGRTVFTLFTWRDPSSAITFQESRGRSPPATKSALKATMLLASTPADLRDTRHMHRLIFTHYVAGACIHAFAIDREID
jgi:hypothetical protein